MSSVGLSVLGWRWRTTTELSEKLSWTVLLDPWSLALICFSGWTVPELKPSGISRVAYFVVVSGSTMDLTLKG